MSRLRVVRTLLKSDRMKSKPEAEDGVAAAAVDYGNRTIVLVGLMGAGKSSVGRRLAAALNLPFRDADTEIETAFRIFSNCMAKRPSGMGSVK